MAVRSQELGAFEADGAVTEGGALGATGDDADVLGHIRGEFLPTNIFSSLVDFLFGRRVAWKTTASLARLPRRGRLGPRFPYNLDR